jgi:lipopolysaccharide/colanic/teichoic acid biosynthesis glycosyltransferase
MALESAEKVQQLTGSLVYRDGLRFRERMWAERLVKRFIDVTASLFVIVVGFPFFLAIALLIRLTSKGPVFFAQERIGEKGEVFTLFKFRTMRLNVDDGIHREFTRRFIEGRFSNSAVDEKSSSVYKLKDDPRVTPVGCFLRKTSLDELP